VIDAEILHIIALKDNQIFDLKRDKQYWEQASMREFLQSKELRGRINELEQWFNQASNNVRLKDERIEQLENELERFVRMIEEPVPGTMIRIRKSCLALLGKENEE